MSRAENVTPLDSEDLAPLLLAAGPPAGNVTFRQGVIKTWNPLTAENTVEVGGTVLTDLPTIASSAEVLTMQAGDVVGLQAVSSGGWSTMYIIGRITRPGMPQAGTALAMIGAKAASENTPENTSSSTYTDLTTVGPSVSDVLIGATGRCLVIVAADITLGGSGLSGVKNAYMAYDISGPTNRSASDDDALILWHALPLNEQLIARMSAASLETGLTPGTTYSVTAKYKSINGPATFHRRHLTVIPL